MEAERKASKELDDRLQETIKVEAETRENKKSAAKAISLQNVRTIVLKQKDKSRESLLRDEQRQKTSNDIFATLKLPEIVMGLNKS